MFPAQWEAVCSLDDFPVRTFGKFLIKDCDDPLPEKTDPSNSEFSERWRSQNRWFCLGMVAHEDVVIRFGVPSCRSCRYPSTLGTLGRRASVFAVDERMTRRPCTQFYKNGPKISPVNQRVFARALLQQ